VSWEDIETRKDPNSIYLFLSTLGKGTKAKANQGKLTQQALLVLQGHAKSCPQTGMRREDYDALNPTVSN
jgi:hypothetical protein